MSRIILAIQITCHVLFQQFKLHVTYCFSNSNYMSRIISAIQTTSRTLFQQSKLHLACYLNNPNYISFIISTIQISAHILFQQSKFHLTYYFSKFRLLVPAQPSSYSKQAKDRTSEEPQFDARCQH